MHVSVYVISPWSRDAEGSVPQLVLDAIANGWQTTIEDVTSQPASEIRLGHFVLVDLICTPETLESIRKHGRYSVLQKDGEITQEEMAEFSGYARDVLNLSVRATREMSKQLIVERFRQQGLKDDLKDAVQDSVREILRENSSSA